MPKRARQRIAPTDDWEQLQFALHWPEQVAYELIRPIMLFGRSPVFGSTRSGWTGRTASQAATTQYYVSARPTKLAQAYRDAGYFARNVRAIEVLIDQQAILQG